MHTENQRDSDTDIHGHVNDSELRQNGQNGSGAGAGVNSKVRIEAGLDRPMDNVKPLGEQSRAVRRQALMVLLGNIGVMSTGMGLGMPTVTMRQLTDPNEPIYLSQSQASWFASINTLSCPLGGLLSSVLLDRLGRKHTLYVLNLISLIAWVLMAISTQNDPQIAYMQLMLSRFLIGISAGLASAPVGVYSAEISMPKVRGRLILGTSLAIASGITLIYLLGYFIRDDWRLITLILCVYQIVSLIAVIPLPETPNWLLSKGRIAEAKKSLNYFRGLEQSAVIVHPEVDAEFNALQKSIQLGSGAGEKKTSLRKLLHLPEVYKPLLILCGLFAFQQLTGIFVVIVYAVQIATEAGVSIDPFMCAVLIGVARVGTTLPLGFILEKWGRRRSGIISALGMCVCMLLLAGHGWLPWLQRVPLLPVVAIVSFIIVSTIGLYTLPFFMISEMFPQNVRGPASGLTVAIGMFFAFICIKTYPAMKDVIGNQWSFVVYGIMAFIATLFIYVALPETRGRTLLEIEEQFRSGKQSGNTARRRQQQLAETEMQEVFIK